MVRRVEKPAVVGLFRFGKASSMTIDKDQGRSPGEISPGDRESIRQRASDLGSKLEAAKQRHTPARSSGADPGALGRAWRVSAELIGGVIAGGALGWFLDAWLGTRPFLFILLFLLGSAAGILNVVRQAQRERTPPAPSVKDVDED
jgi:ATP synthase protein I